MSRTHETLNSLFSDIADAIREKDGTQADIVADTFPARIENIPAGGGGGAVLFTIVDGELIGLGEQSQLDKWAKTNGVLTLIDEQEELDKYSKVGGEIIYTLSTD